jgi:hypothetical protein
MVPLALEGHYGQSVDTDLCGHCNLLWLDALESVNFSGLGWVKLLRRMGDATAEPTGPLRSELNCPRCRQALKTVFNQSRLGFFGELECSNCRGTLASFSLLLAQRGLVRTLTRRDLDTLQNEQRQPTCLNCGAGLTREQCASPTDRESRCPYCLSPLLVIDMPRFLGALLTRHAEALTPDRVGWACRGCGSALEPTHSAACGTCGHLVVVPALLDLRPVLEAVEPQLLAAQPRGPRRHGHRLREMRGDARQTALYRYLRALSGWLLWWR